MIDIPIDRSNYALVPFAKPVVRNLHVPHPVLQFRLEVGVDEVQRRPSAKVIGCDEVAGPTYHAPNSPKFLLPG